MKGVIIMVLVFTLVSTTGYGLRNECNICNFVAGSDDLICKNCGKYVNECVFCKHPNTVKSDSCTVCCSPLVESRDLSTVSPESRSNYQLGKAPRAVLDRENSQIQCFLERTPAQEAQLLFQLGMNLKEMKFYAREVEAWGNYLIKFPNHPESAMAKSYRSEAYVNWGYLFFGDGNFMEAENKFRAAASENPRNVEALVWLARTNLAMGYVTEGKYYCRAALAINPGDERAKYLMKANSRSLRKVPSRDSAKTRYDNSGGESEVALWFPEVSVGQLK